MPRHIAMLLLLLTAACKVGQPLVGEKKFMDGELHGLCSRPPMCDEFWGPAPTPDHPAQPLQGCASPKLCRLGDEELGLGGCPREKLESLPLAAACAELELMLDAGAEDIVLDGVEWDEVNLTLRTERPVALVMRGGTLASVHMQLEGPVALRIEQLDLLQDLRINGAANGGGSPSVGLDLLHGNRFSVGAPEQPFPGRVEMHAVLLEDIDLRGAACTFESVLLQDASVRVDTLSFTDVTLARAWLEADRALVSAFSVEDSVLHFCGDVRLIDGRLTRTELSACLEHPVHLYASTFNSGVMDGAYELDDVNINGSRVGSRDTTRIVGYNTHLSTAQLCENLEQLALGGGSYARCSNCYDGIAEDAAVCAIEPLKDALSGNYCKAWQDLDQPPTCGGDLPTEPDRVR